MNPLQTNASKNQTERRFSLFIHGNCSGHLHTEPKTCHWTKRTTKSPLNSKYCVNHICVSRLYKMHVLVVMFYSTTTHGSLSIGSWFTRMVLSRIQRLHDGRSTSLVSSICILWNIVPASILYTGIIRVY